MCLYLSLLTVIPMPLGATAIWYVGPPGIMRLATRLEISINTWLLFGERSCGCSSDCTCSKVPSASHKILGLVLHEGAEQSDLD